MTIDGNKKKQIYDSYGFIEYFDNYDIEKLFFHSSETTAAQKNEYICRKLPQLKINDANANIFSIKIFLISIISHFFGNTDAHIGNFVITPD